MDNDALVTTLRDQLREVQYQLSRVPALKREQAALIHLIAHYEGLKSGLVAIPDPKNPAQVEEYQASFPRIMTFTVRRLLETDLGPSNTVPNLYAAIAETYKKQFGGKDERSKIETLRGQIITWKAEIGLDYQRGVVSLSNPTGPKLALQPGLLVDRSAMYRCLAHPETRQQFAQEESFGFCPVGGPDCNWTWDSKIPDLGVFNEASDGTYSPYVRALLDELGKLSP